ncbi:Uu.00g060170.m01.CDS01 [Anthostomella pinea]|uniref:ribonuclease Z n=1 Tax=Anthostomella pinea TaxID=933095 RepID=A0AAI8VS78_9PEZI|nr:Uu.00g060170.m01.CDS01 [Anthostomella pinea]
MQSKHAAAHAARRLSHLLKLSPYTGPRRLFPPFVKSRFANTRLPTALFNGPNLSVLPATSADRKLRARFLLLQTSQPTTFSQPTASSQSTAAPTKPAARALGRRMLNYLQVVTTPTADTSGTALLLHFDNQRYIFGQVAEGTQRALVQRKVALNKVEDVFLTGLVNWQNAGGLLGLILTLADMLASSKQSALDGNSERKKKGKAGLRDGPSAKLNIHGSKNLSHLLATARRFIFRKGLPLTPHEIRQDPRIANNLTAEPDWKDDNINVWYMPVESSQSRAASPRKRSHEEFTESAGATNSSTSTEEEDQKLVKTVVTQMFDSDWTMDALVETTLQQAKLPAKIFVRDDHGHIQVYTGPMPGGNKNVPDIPVLVRQPWPGAMVTSLPRTAPSQQSMCYIVKGHERRGKFNVQQAEKLGVAKRDYKVLAGGSNAVGKDGAVVTPEMVLGETVAGSGFAVVDLPDCSYVDPLISRTEWSNSQIMKGIHVIVWVLGRDVANDNRLQDFMQKMPSVRHIVSSGDSCPNMIALESVAAQAYKLRCIDPERFPLPVHSNELSLSNAPCTTSSTYETNRSGKTVQFAPQFLCQDDKIVPFPDIPKMARSDLSREVLRMAEETRTKVSDPEFLAKVEKAESDIPNRDAEIITLGTGSALPSKYRNVSATLVRVPGYGNYLFDAGENTLGQMRRVFGDELPKVLQDLKAIWISHLHADHHLGTASVIKAWHAETRNSLPSAKLHVASHTHMIDWLEEYSSVEDYGYDRLVATKFSHYDASTRISEPRVFTSKETEAWGLAKIEVCWVNHCFGALATAFTFPSGLKIAYSGDCRPSDAFVQIGQGSTILIHESTFDDELQGDAVAKKHSTMSEAIDVGRRMGARRILLTHFSQRYQKVPVIEENFEVRADADTKDKARTDEVILVAFDYMRLKLGEFRKAQAFLPAIQKLFEDVEQ